MTLKHVQEEGTASDRWGATVLVVEDEFLIAMDLEDILTRNGCRVIGPAASVDAALALLEAEAPQVALLDVNLRGEWVTPVAEALSDRGVPFVVVTAYASDELDDAPILRDAMRLAKPISERRLMLTLERRTQGLVGRRPR